MPRYLSQNEWCCPNCLTTQVVDRDEDGVAIGETTPCHDDSHKKALCQFCPQFSCSFCGLTHCDEHLHVVPDGPGKPLSLCDVCFDSMCGAELAEEAAEVACA